MKRFSHRFTVSATQEAVSAFHHDTRALKRLTPPPLFVQLHAFEPLAEGATAEFTLWIGPVPARWRSVHHDVGLHGFTDEQALGPMQRWRHTHRFTPVDDGRTLISDEIEYEHPSGMAGIFTRLLFNTVGLTLLFKYREMATRWFLLPAGQRAKLLRISAGTIFGFLLLLGWRGLASGNRHAE